VALFSLRDRFSTDGRGVNRQKNRIPPSGCPPATDRERRRAVFQHFREKTCFFQPLTGPPFNFGRNGTPGRAGFPDSLQDCRFFAVRTRPLNCTVFSLLKSCFCQNTCLYEEFCRALAPLPLEISGAGSCLGTLRRKMDHGRLTVRQDAPLIKVGRSCFGDTSPGMQVRVPVRLSTPRFANRKLADKNLFEKFPDP
jgi:hypothetical protein